MKERIKKLKRRRLFGLIIVALSFLLGSLGYNIYIKADRELIKLDKQRLNESRLK